jgi:hypothetical protein
MNQSDIAQTIYQVFFSDVSIPLGTGYAIAIAYAIRSALIAGLKYAVDKFLLLHPTIVTQQKLDEHVAEAKKYVADYVEFNKILETQKNKNLPNPNFPTIITK